MSVHALSLATCTHQGLVRSTNQDYLKVDGKLGIAILADGMGGHRGGEVASRVAVEAAFEDLKASQYEGQSDETQSQLRVGHSLEAANRALFNMTELYPELTGMGTTLVAAIFREECIYYGHVGDSRLYRVRYGRLRRLTRDHSLIQRMIDEGVFMNRNEAHEAGIRDNILTRSLGMQHNADIDLGGNVLEAGDTYLICSDGLHGCITDTTIARILRDPNGDIEQQAQALVDAALAQGGPDNVSVVLARPLLG
jgi:protein phosphatase